MTRELVITQENHGREQRMGDVKRKKIMNLGRTLGNEGTLLSRMLIGRYVETVIEMQRAIYREGSKIIRGTEIVSVTVKISDATVLQKIATNLGAGIILGKRVEMRVMRGTTQDRETGETAVG